MSARARFAWAAAILASLALHAASKVHAGESPQEMLWGCHVASAVAALGLVLDAPRLVAAAFVFHLGVGIPSWLLDAIGTGVVGPSSALVHLLPPLAGALYVRRRGLPWLSAADAYGLLLSTWALALVATDPALNIMAAHRAWAGMQELWPEAWQSRLFNALVAIPCLAAATLVARRLVVPQALRSGAQAG